MLVFSTSTGIVLTIESKDQQTRVDKAKRTPSIGTLAVSIALAITALAAAFLVPLSIIHPTNLTNYCNDTNLSQTFCSKVVTTNCVTPSGSLETSSIQCISGDYDYLLTVPATHCSSEYAAYFNTKNETGFSHLVSSGGVGDNFPSL